MSKSYKLASRSLCHEVISHAESEYRLVSGKDLLQHFESLFALACAARAVRHIYTIILHIGVIIVVWNSDDLCATCEKASDDAVLHSEVHNDHFLA